MKKETLNKKFEIILNQLIESADSDMIEAEANASAYFEMVDGDEDSRAIYGQLYHDSLKIKYNVRERSLKIANLIKERLSKIETDELKEKSKGSDGFVFLNHKEMSEFLKNSKKEGLIKNEENKPSTSDLLSSSEETFMEYEKKRDGVE